MGVSKFKRQRGSIERPWGWVVMTSAFIVHILSYGFAWSSGVLNAIFIDTFDDVPVVDISWVGTLVLGNMLASGAIAGLVVTRYGYRVTTFIGGGLTCLGMFLSFFAPNVYFLYFSLGIVSGIGGGFSFLGSVSAVTHWFDYRRPLALGITSAGLGFGQFVFPALIRWLYQRFDWTGVLLILGGISLNICVGAAVFRPAPLLETKPPVDGEESEEAVTFSYCSFFKNFGYLSMCLNNLLVCFGLSIVYIHLPAYGESVGIDPTKSALLLSAMGLANVFGRIAFGIFDQYLVKKTAALYGSAFMLSGVVVLLMPVTSNYPFQLCFSVLFGFFSGCFGVLLALILAQLIGIRHFSAGYGFILLFEGIGTLTGGPFAGFMYDVTGTYVTSLYVSGGCLIASAACVILPHCIIIRPQPGIQVEIEEECVQMNGHAQKSESLVT